MTDIKTLALQCRAAAQQLGLLSSAARSALLEAMAAALEADAEAILVANARDLQAFLGVGKDFSTWIKK